LEFPSVKAILTKGCRIFFLESNKYWITFSC
jgi:hypothetical protein